MVQVKRLTRAEKIAQAKALKKGVIEDPRHLIGLPVGSQFQPVGRAATELDLAQAKADGGKRAN